MLVRNVYLSCQVTFLNEHLYVFIYFDFFCEDGTPQCRVIVNQNLTEIEFREVLREKFPNLPDRFEFCKVSSDRKVIPLRMSTMCPAEIKSNNTLGRSALYLRPLVSRTFLS